MAMVDAAYQWVDLDPFGSPIQFLDAALQSLSRTGVLEVTATDTACLDWFFCLKSSTTVPSQGNR
jgi:tRNA (guanine26-N2/guanine27-N2)-dimethyltransferase